MILPTRTAATTAALRRTTHRSVFGGGRSSVDCTGGAGCWVLFTGHPSVPQAHDKPWRAVYRWRLGSEYTPTADERPDSGVISVLLHNLQLNVQTIPSIGL